MIRHSKTKRDFFRGYRKDRKKWKNKLEYKEYSNIIDDFLDEVMKLIIEERYIFKLPFRLGFISVRKAPINKKKLRVDFKKTKEVGKVVYHLNMHSDNNYFYIYWDKYNSYSNFTNMSYYKFSPVRAVSRYMAAFIRKCSDDPFSKNYEAFKAGK